MGIAMRLRGNYRQQVDEWFESQIMRAFFYGFPSYSGQGLDGTGASALFIPYFMLTSGVYFPVGGVAAIPMAFERLANELGVTFRLGDAVAKVDTDGNQVTQVRTQSGEIYIADRFIANVDRFTFGSLLGREVDVAPSFSYFTMHAGVPRRIQGLSHHNLLIPRDFVDSFDDLYKKRIFPRHPIVYVNDTTMNDPEAAPTGSTNLFSVVTCPAMESHLDWEFEKLRAETATTDTLARFGIQLDDAEFCRIQTPQTFADRDKNFKGSLYGVDETFRPFKGMMPFPNHDPQYQNLRYCGGSVQPGAGLPMVTLSGRFAAES
jgi:phytoene dehydrogenase-like protein